MKKYFILLAAFLYVNVSISAQTGVVQITDGRFFIGTGYQASTAEMRSAVFTSTSHFNTNTPSNPWGVCQNFDCKPGSTFTVPYVWAIMSDEQHRFGTFTINGTTYEGVAFSGGLSVSRETFLIPRTIPRKGYLYLRSPFTLSGRLRVCQVSDFANGCPADKILFDRNVSGYGTLTVKMKVKVNENSKYQTYIQPENFQYQFEP
jgi:hypothetical protein